MANWYYRKNGQVVGPITSAQLKRLADTGELKPEDSIRKEGHDRWIPAAQVKHLFRTEPSADDDDSGNKKPRPVPPPLPVLPAGSSSDTSHPAPVGATSPRPPGIDLASWLTPDRVLALVSCVWLGLYRAVDARLSLVVTLGLLVADTVVALMVVFRQKRAAVLLNLAQLALFALVHFQIYTVLGKDLYRCDREPGAYDWVQFTGSHVLRAVDVLDFIEEFGIDLQHVKHAAIIPGMLLVVMHLTVDLFLLGVVIRWGAKLWQGMVEARARRNQQANPSGGISLAQQTSVAERLGQNLHAARAWCLLVCVGLFVVSAWAQSWKLRDWWLWPVDTILRVVDIADAMHIFDWRLHGVTSSYWLATLAVSLRLFAGLYIAEGINYLQLKSLRGLLQTIEELTHSLTNRNPELRKAAAESLGEYGANAQESVGALVLALADPDTSVRQAAKAALARIDPRWEVSPGAQTAVPALVQALTNTDPSVRLAAATTLPLINPLPQDVAPAMIRALADTDQEVRTAVQSALTRIGTSTPTGVDVLILALGDSSQEFVREGVKRALAGIPLQVSTVVPALIKVLSHQHELVRAEAASVLAMIGSKAKAAVPALLRTLREVSNSVRVVVEEALEKIGIEAIPELIEALTGRDDLVRRAVATVLGKIEPQAKEAVPSLIRATVDPNKEVRQAAEASLAKINPQWVASPQAQAAVPDIRQALGHQDWTVCQAAANLLGRIGERASAAIPLLIGTMNHAEVNARQAAAEALGKIGPQAKDAVPSLVRALIDGNASVRTAAEASLSKINPQWAASPQALEGVPDAIEALTGQDLDVCQAGMNLLGKIGSPAKAAIPALVRMLVHQNENVRQVAAATLGRIDPRWAASHLALEALPDLLRAMIVPSVRGCAVETVIRIGLEAVPALIRALVHPHPDVRTAAEASLSKINPQWAASPQALEVVPDAIEALTGQDLDVCQAGMNLLGKIGSPAKAAIPALIRMLVQQNENVRQVAVPTLGRIDPQWAASPLALEALPDLIRAMIVPSVRGCAVETVIRIGLEAVPALIRALVHPHPDVRTSAEAPLSKINPQWAASPQALEVVPDAIEALTGQDLDVCQAGMSLLGKIGSPAKAAIPALVRKLVHQNENVRQVAAETLGKVEPQWAASPPALETLPDLIRALADSTSSVRLAAVRALGEIGPSAHEAVPELIRMLADQSPVVSEAAVEAMGKIDPRWATSSAAQEAIVSFIRALADSTPRVRLAAVRTLEAIGPAAHEAVPNLIDALADRDQEVHLAAARTLGRIGKAASAAEPALIRMLVHRNVRGRKVAAESLGRINSRWVDSSSAQSHALVFSQMLADRNGDPAVRVIMAEALGVIGPVAPEVLSVLIRMLNDREQSVRRAAHEAIGQIGHRAVPALSEALTHEEESIRRSAADILRGIGPAARQP